jgi:hypothetical protein
MVATHSKPLGKGRQEHFRWLAAGRRCADQVSERDRGYYPLFTKALIYKQNYQRMADSLPPPNTDKIKSFLK